MKGGPSTGAGSSTAAPPGPRACRAVDLVVAALAITALAPLLAAVALAIAVADGRPVLFRQERLGRGFRPFRICKFRTMRVPAAGENRYGMTAAGDAAITPLGRYLRRWRLDELPQLWNILRGEMSIFGPRPELPQYVAVFQTAYDELLAVRPGLLDPATIQFLGEADLLPPGPDREDIYRTQILPQKITLSLAYLRRRTWHSDLCLVFAAAAALWRQPASAAAFGAGPSAAPQPGARGCALATPRSPCVPLVRERSKRESAAL